MLEKEPDTTSREPSPADNEVGGCAEGDEMALMPVWFWLDAAERPEDGSNVVVYLSADELEPQKPRAPVRIIAKKLGQSDQLFYKLLWDDSSETLVPLFALLELVREVLEEEPLDSNCCSNWLSLIEDFEHAPSQPASLTSPPPLEPRRTRSGQPPSRRTERSGKPSHEGSLKGGPRKAGSSINGSEAHDSDGETGSQVSGLTERRRSSRLHDHGSRIRKKRNPDGAPQDVAKKKNSSLTVEEESVRSSNGGDEEDGSNAGAKSPKRRTGSTLVVESDDSDSGELKDCEFDERLIRMEISLICLITRFALNAYLVDSFSALGLKGEKQRIRKSSQKEDDFVGSIGDLYHCGTCSASFHDVCNPKQKSSSTSSVDEPRILQCLYCAQSKIPTCMICSKPPRVDLDSVKAELHDVDLKTFGSFGEYLKGVSKSGKGDVPIEMLFRCERCSFVAHLDCVEAEFGSIPDFDPAEAFNPSSHPLGSRKNYLQQWDCNDCIKWRKDPETVLTYRERMPHCLPRSPFEGRNREYFVKFEWLSHRYCDWVPESWLAVVGKRRLAHFTKHLGNSPAPPADSVIDKDHLTVEKILNIEFVDSKKETAFWSKMTTLTSERDMSDLVSAVDEVLVKWVGLSYDECTWEDVPTVRPVTPSMTPDAKAVWELEKEMRPSFLGGLKDYCMRYRIGIEYAASGKKRARIRANKPKFIELKSQPECITWGRLKEYQMDGLNWLIYKWTKDIPCILADEMGLGKTLQIVSFINILLHNHKLYPFLIIAPTITIGHWMNEFRRWAPKVSFVHYHGTKAERDMIRQNEIYFPVSGSASNRNVRFHVMLVSYEVMLLDSTLFKGIEFEGMICDEGHRLKNDAGRTFKSLVANVQTNHKILLTGTPLQNNLKELFNLMNFLDPKAWPDPKELQVEFENINDEKILALHKASLNLGPYFLRRTKAQVLSADDIPAKGELLVPVSLTRFQKELYKKILQRNSTLLRATDSGLISENRAVPLHNILMELRKLCDHPWLLQSLDAKISKEEYHRALVGSSGKLEFLQTLLQKLKAKGHRVLIFSQFKMALDIVEDFLTGEGYKYQRIDGNSKSTTRQGLIDEFNQEGSELFVFLLTTRTGGVGINLTSADTVVILDEEQLKVTIFRSLSAAPDKTTLIERIIEIGKKKLVLDHLVVERMADKQLDKKDLADIIRYGAQSLFEDNDVDALTRYDDAAVEKLLNRESILAEQIPAAEDAETSTVNKSFSFARVWTLDKEEEELPSSESIKELIVDGAHDNVSTAASDQAAAPVEEGNFWDKLFDSHAPLAEQSIIHDEPALELPSKRKRKVVNYNIDARKRRGKDQVQGRSSDSADDPDYVSAGSETESSGGSVDDESVGRMPASLLPPAVDAPAPSALPVKPAAQMAPLSALSELTPTPLMTLRNSFRVCQNSDDRYTNGQSNVVCFLCGRKKCRYRFNCTKSNDPSTLERMGRVLASEPPVGVEGLTLEQSRRLVLGRLHRKTMGRISAERWARDRLAAERRQIERGVGGALGRMDGPLPLEAAAVRSEGGASRSTSDGSIGGVRRDGSVGGGDVVMGERREGGGAMKAGGESRAFVPGYGNAGVGGGVPTGVGPPPSLLPQPASAVASSRVQSAPMNPGVPQPATSNPTAPPPPASTPQATYVKSVQGLSATAPQPKSTQAHPALVNPTMAQPTSTTVNPTTNAGSRPNTGIPFEHGQHLNRSGFGSVPSSAQPGHHHLPASVGIAGAMPAPHSVVSISAGQDPLVPPKQFPQLLPAPPAAGVLATPTLSGHALGAGLQGGLATTDGRPLEDGRVRAGQPASLASLVSHGGVSMQPSTGSVGSQAGMSQQPLPGSSFGQGQQPGSGSTLSSQIGRGQQQPFSSSAASLVGAVQQQQSAPASSVMGQGRGGQSLSSSTSAAMRAMATALVKELGGGRGGGNGGEGRPGGGIAGPLTAAQMKQQYLQLQQPSVPPNDHEKSIGKERIAATTTPTNLITNPPSSTSTTTLRHPPQPIAPTSTVQPHSPRVCFFCAGSIHPPSLTNAGTRGRDEYLDGMSGCSLLERDPGLAHASLQAFVELGAVPPRSFDGLMGLAQRGLREKVNRDLLVARRFAGMVLGKEEGGRGGK
ncbi:hypothetical protein HDU67_008082 [Dinochytrium kinnereticum]|nr:hypothetical protein HDU67_008082 [Dinochytrium kinnereticum]